jgi:hypothetical protein
MVIQVLGRDSLGPAGSPEKNITSVMDRRMAAGERTCASEAINVR